MLRCVSKAFAVFLAVLSLSAMAQTTFTGMAGVDHWSIHGGPARYLPDYATTNPWKPTSAWAKGTVSTSIDTDHGPLTFTAQAQTSEITGNRIDRLDADLRFGHGFGGRLGILPYRVSWCRTYDERSPWLSEPDGFCRYSGLNEVAQGAFGAQVYHSDIVGGWMVDAMAGIYRPTVDGQNKRLGPYASVGPTVAHSAFGASVNALHLASGIQTRAGWIRTDQVQNDTTGSRAAYQRHIGYDSYYLAAEGNATRQIDVRASLAGYLGNQLAPANPFHWDGRSTTVEAIWKPAQGHSFALGYTRYTNRTVYKTGASNKQFLIVPSTSVAWRFDLPAGWWGVAQWSDTTDDYTLRSGAQTVRRGSAFGFRLAKSF